LKMTTNSTKTKEKENIDEDELIKKFIKDFEDYGKKAYFCNKKGVYQTNLSSYLKKKKNNNNIKDAILEFYDLNDEEKIDFFVAMRFTQSSIRPRSQDQRG